MKKHSTRGVLIGALVVLMGGLAGCDVLGPDDSTFSDTRLYAHDFFDSYAECEAAQPSPDFWMNCSMTAVFCPTGTVHYMETDIVHLGTYSVNGSEVVIRLPDNPETSTRIRFRLSSDHRTLTESDSGVAWELKEGPEHEWAQETCG